MLMLNFKILQPFFIHFCMNYFYLNLRKDYTALLEDNTLNHCINWILFLVFFWKLAAWRKHFDVLENEMRQNLLYELYETEVGSRNTHLRRIYDKWMLAKLEFWKLVLAFVFGLFKQINRTQIKVIIIHVIVLLGMFYLP